MKLHIFGTEAGTALAQKICVCSGRELGKVDHHRFPNGEYRPRILQNVRDTHAAVVCPISAPADKNLVDTLILCDSIRRSSPKRISLILTHFGYGRQDRKDKSRVPLTAKLVANLLSGTGASNIMIFDIHNEATQGFFADNIKVDLLFASKVFIPYLADLDRRNLVVASPDNNGVVRANDYGNFLGVDDFVVITKIRKSNNQVDSRKRKVIGSVKGKVVLMVDDIIDTAGTIVTGAEALMKAGAKQIVVAAAHAVFSETALEKLQESHVSRVIVTDSIDLSGKELGPKVEVVSTASLFSQAITRIHEGGSISELILKS